MPSFLFLQRFENGAPVPLPWQPVIELLTAHGTLGRGRGDVEITFAAGEVAFGCTVIGDAASGVTCIGFERPWFDKALREIVWACLAQFDCTVFDDALEAIHMHDGAGTLLPRAMIEACADGVRALRSVQQLWPQALSEVLEAPPRPAARYDNPNPQAPMMQLFDGVEMERNLLTMEFTIHPAACNPGTLRVLRNLELRVDAAGTTNPEFGIAVRYFHHESSLQFLESPRLGETRCRITLITPLPGESAPARHFVADRALFDSTLAQSLFLTRHALNKYQARLDGSAESVDALAACLDRVHMFHEQQRRAADTASDATIAAWVQNAGGYISTWIRRNVGGQCGYVTSGQRRFPVVRTHSGQICHPWLLALDHIVNGPASSVALQLKFWAQCRASAAPRDEDIVCDIPGFCNILLGKSRFLSEGGLPLEAQIPRDQLDFSVASLAKLDTYLIQVSKTADKLTPLAKSNLALVAGAYLGEVIRCNAPNPAQWNWVNYDDFARNNPGFAQKRPRAPEFMAFLDSAENTAYPIAQVSALLIDGARHATLAYAKLLVEGAGGVGH